MVTCVCEITNVDEKLKRLPHLFSTIHTTTNIFSNTAVTISYNRPNEHHRVISSYKKIFLFLGYSILLQSCPLISLMVTHD